MESPQNLKGREGRSAGSLSLYSGTSGTTIGGVHAAGVPAWKNSMVAPLGKAGKAGTVSKVVAAPIPERHR